MIYNKCSTSFFMEIYRFFIDFLFTDISNNRKLKSLLKCEFGKSGCVERKKNRIDEVSVLYKNSS